MRITNLMPEATPLQHGRKQRSSIAFMTWPLMAEQSGQEKDEEALFEGRGVSSSRNSSKSSASANVKCKLPWR